jgi:hypothetical protein
MNYRSLSFRESLPHIRSFAMLLWCSAINWLFVKLRKQLKLVMIFGGHYIWYNCAFPNFKWFCKNLTFETCFNFRGRFSDYLIKIYSPNRPTLLILETNLRMDGDLCPPTQENTANMVQDSEMRRYGRWRRISGPEIPYDVRSRRMFPIHVLLHLFLFSCSITSLLLCLHARVAPRLGLQVDGACCLRCCCGGRITPELLWACGVMNLPSSQSMLWALQPAFRAPGLTPLHGCRCPLLGVCGIGRRCVRPACDPDQTPGALCNGWPVVAMAADGALCVKQLPLYR